ncbi:MAG: hypothetical protein COV67_05295 [Nitrospinae bacterium CG11_big_fil_rev_8_21_14_0_20_56_8]|nr:MAG: hypothetical protein COV67_05295 [Nitrospinae bacterium CG11_big_fil_rev_8_21_14_0_20_56_8]
MDLWVNGSIIFFSLLALAAGPCGVVGTAGCLAYLFRIRRPACPSPSLRGHIYFRYVTRGDFPNLVRHNVAGVPRLLEGLLTPDRYTVEVVTQKPVGAAAVEMVVPQDYRTPHGSLFKARNLHYALMHSRARNGDWIVHLDEETVMNREGVEALLQYMAEAEREGALEDWMAQGNIVFGAGQGRVAFVKAMDSIRVTWNLTARLAAETLHVFFVVKGSFLVAAQETERKLGWDFPPELCVNEDDTAVLRYPGNLKGRWIEGTFYETSPETLLDLLKQRRRWYHGHRKFLSSRHLNLSQKFQVMVMFLNDWAVFPVWAALISFSLGIPLDPLAVRMAGWVAGLQAVCYGIGAGVNFPGSVGKRLTLASLGFILSPVFLSLQFCSWFWAMATTPQVKFDPFNKERMDKAE